MDHKRVVKYHIIIIEMSIRVYNIIEYVTIFINILYFYLMNSHTLYLITSPYFVPKMISMIIILDLTVSIVVNGKKFSLAVTYSPVKRGGTPVQGFLYQESAIGRVAVTMPSVKLQYINVLKYTDTQTTNRKDRNTNRHRDGHKYFIVAVDEPQL